jgi:hypothetical protein
MRRAASRIDWRVAWAARRRELESYARFAFVRVMMSLGL